jgi:hypothetical protein
LLCSTASPARPLSFGPNDQFGALANVFVTVFGDGLADFLADVFAGAADFCVPLAEALAFDFVVSVTVSGAFFVVAVIDEALVVVGGSGLATTLSTTVETLTRLTSLITALVLGGKGAMLKAVTGVLTVTCSITSASTPTDRRTTVDDVAVRDWVETATRSGGVVEAGSVVGGTVGCVTGSVEGTAGLEGGGAAAGGFAAAVPAIVDEIVTDPMVLTVVVVRRGLGVLVAGGVVARGGVDAMTKDVTNGPACEVGVDRRERTWRAEALATIVVSDADLFTLGLARCGDVVVAPSAGNAPNQSENATAAPRPEPTPRRGYCFVTLEPSGPESSWP